MKREEEILGFSLIYIVLLTTIYSFVFYDLKGWILFFFLMMMVNLPSFLVILLGNYFERKRRIEISEILYCLLSIGLFSSSITVFRQTSQDPRRIFPVFEEPILIISFFSLVAHFIGYFLILFIRKLIKRFN